MRCEPNKAIYIIPNERIILSNIGRNKAYHTTNGKETINEKKEERKKQREGRCEKKCFPSLRGALDNYQFIQLPLAPSSPIPQSIHHEINPFDFTVSRFLNHLRLLRKILQQQTFPIWLHSFRFLTTSASPENTATATFRWLSTIPINIRIENEGEMYMVWKRRRHRLQ